MDAANVRQELRAFITRTLIRDPSYPLGDGDPIITAGLIDSFALAELAVFIERRWQVFIPDPELSVERMNTLDQMVARVMKA
jgi:acyl carrier protein